MKTLKTTKYYVESGSQLQVVVLACSPLEAISKALQKTSQDAPLHLANVMIVNQRGFVWHREGRKLNGDETIVPTRLLLGHPERNTKLIDKIR